MRCICAVFTHRNALIYTSMSTIDKNKLYIEPLSEKHFAAILHFTDQVIGSNYYTKKDLNDVFTNSQGCSYVLTNADQIFGIRFSYAPETPWVKTMRCLSLHLWQASPEKVAYFKSAFIHPQLRGCGFGKKLALRSIESIKSLKAQAIVCHSHVESPENGSYMYLTNLGFKEVKTWPHFWANIDYLCATCEQKPCICTAKEMILYT